VPAEQERNVSEQIEPSEPPKRKRLGWAITVLILTLTSCGIPDLKPFSDATAEMASQLRSAFEKTQAAIGFAAATSEDGSEFSTKSRQLNERWEPTRKAIAALVDYSDSIAAVAEAGKKGEQTVGRLIDSANDLASAVGVLPLTGTAASIAKAVGAKLIQLKAERDIKKAVRNATEAVDELVPPLKENFVALRNIHTSAANAWEAHVQGESSILTNYYESLVAEERRLQFLLTLIVQYQSASDRLRFRAAQAIARGDKAQADRLIALIETEKADNLKVLAASDAVLSEIDLTKDPAAAVETRQRMLMDLINAQRKEIALLEPKYQKARADLDRVRDTRQLGARVLAKASDAIDGWHKAHQSLRATVDGQQSRPSTGELISVVKEIAALVR
jgi:hypothetical protein